MATAGSLLNDFVSQNAIILIAGVITTVIVIAASTYFIARNYLTSNISVVGANAPEEQDETSATSQAASNSKTEESEDDGSGDSIEGRSAIDPVHYCEHIQGEIKKVRQDVTTRKICEELSAEQIAEEHRRQQDQLADIFNLMKAQQEKFGISSMDEMKDQMRLYADFN